MSDQELYETEWVSNKGRCWDTRLQVRSNRYMQIKQIIKCLPWTKTRIGHNPEVSGQSGFKGQGGSWQDSEMWVDYILVS